MNPPVVSRTLDYIDSLTPFVQRHDVSSATMTLMIELGFDTSIDGFYQVRQIIVLCRHNPHMRITDLYQELAQLSNEKAWTTHLLAQSIHTAIVNAYKHPQRNPEVWNVLFNQEIWNRPPNNKTFVTRLGRLMELWDCRREDYHGIE